MVVLHLGSAFRRWVVAGCACLLLGLAVRWGLAGEAGGPFHGATSRVPLQQQVVAITFNLPSGDATSLARALQASGLPATAFVSAATADANRTALQALSAAGAEVETLGWDAGAPPLGGAALQAALRRVAGAVAADTGIPPLFVRPPQGAASAALVRAADAIGLGVVTQSANLTAGDPTALAAQVDAHLAPGAILTLPATASAAALQAVGDDLRARGYEPVTLAGLFALAEGTASVSLASLA